MVTRIVYTDLDGTMVGPGGSFFRTESGDPTLEPARALLDLHRAEVTLVLVSGRTRPQLVEAGRIFGADGFVGELGAVLGWDRGRQFQVLRGAMPEEYAGQTPMQVLNRLRVVEELFARWPGRLEWHSPWHDGHEADAMLRGLVGNGARQPHMRELIAGHDNVRVCSAGVGLGWAEAVRAALGG